MYMSKRQKKAFIGALPQTLLALSVLLEIRCQELKKNFEQAYSDYIETAKELNEDWIYEFENPNLVYELDLQEFFKLVPKISMTGIAKKANINTSLLRQ